MRITIDNQLLEKISHNINTNKVFELLENNKIIYDESSSNADTLKFHVDNEEVSIECKNGSAFYVSCTCSNSLKNHRITPDCRITCEHALSVVLYLDDYLKKSHDNIVGKQKIDNYCGYISFNNNIVNDLNTIFYITTMINSDKGVNSLVSNYPSVVDTFLGKYIDYLNVKSLKKFFEKDYKQFNTNSPYSMYKNIGRFEITEEYIMNNYESLNIDFIKNMYPGLFDDENMSIAFKLFIMMKGMN